MADVIVHNSSLKGFMTIHSFSKGEVTFYIDKEESKTITASEVETVLQNASKAWYESILKVIKDEVQEPSPNEAYLLLAILWQYAFEPHYDTDAWRVSINPTNLAQKILTDKEHKGSKKDEISWSWDDVAKSPHFHWGYFELSSLVWDELFDDWHISDNRQNNRILDRLTQVPKLRIRYVIRPKLCTEKVDVMLLFNQAPLAYLVLDRSKVINALLERLIKDYKFIYDPGYLGLRKGYERLLSHVCCYEVLSIEDIPKQHLKITINSPDSESVVLIDAKGPDIAKGTKPNQKKLNQAIEYLVSWRDMDLNEYQRFRSAVTEKTGQRNQKQEKLPPSVSKAYKAYLWLQSEQPELGNQRKNGESLSVEEHMYLIENYEDLDHPDYKVPNDIETFRRYIRTGNKFAREQEPELEARDSKGGKSIVRYKDNDIKRSS